MRAILSAAIVGLAFAATPTTTQPQDAGDIRMNPLLSRPLTVMEHVLIKLQQEAEESAEEMARTSYSDKYKPMRSQSWSARIGLDDDTGRIVSEKTIYITSIDDPWREVCEDLLTLNVQVSYDTDSALDVGRALGLFDQIQASREKKIATYFQMMKSILVRLVFFSRGDQGYRARVCEYDARTKQYNFVEHSGKSKLSP